eukprot:m.92948 g.92948  ORF g.92948 m.92948 type:complete len:84 (+) comp12091_c0_seq2:122-373(+)
MAAQIIQIARALAPSARTYLPYVVAPVAIIVGYIGFEAEEFVKDQERRDRDNAAPVPKIHERLQRRARERQSDLAKSEPRIES